MTLAACARSCALLQVALLLMPASSEGQQRMAREFPLYNEERAHLLDPVTGDPHVAPRGMIAVGLLAGAGAAAAGWCGGLHLWDSDAGAFWSAAAAATATIPVSVHLTNRSRGALESALGASAAVGLAGVLLMSTRSNDADATASVLANLGQVLVDVAEFTASESGVGRERA